MVGYKRVPVPFQITVSKLSKSRDTDVQLLPNDRSTNTFQVVHCGTKTFQIGSNTFQLLVPKLFRSIPLLTNSHSTKIFQVVYHAMYQNFPDRFHHFSTHRTKTFHIHTTDRQSFKLSEAPVQKSIIYCHYQDNRSQ